MAKFSRKKKLINSGLQLKLVSAFLAMAVVAALFQVVLLNTSLLSLTEDMGVNLAGAEVALRLMVRIEQLESEMKHLTEEVNHLRAQARSTGGRSTTTA